MGGLLSFRGIVCVHSVPCHVRWKMNINYQACCYTFIHRLMTSNLAHQHVLFTAICPLLCACSLSHTFPLDYFLILPPHHLLFDSFSIVLSESSSSPSLPHTTFPISTPCVYCVRAAKIKLEPETPRGLPMSLIAIHQNGMLLNIFTGGQLVTPDSDKHLGQWAMWAGHNRPRQQSSTKFNEVQHESSLSRTAQ